MRELNKEKRVEKEKTVVVRFSSTNEMSVKNALQIIIKTHDDITEGELSEAR